MNSPLPVIAFEVVMIAAAFGLLMAAASVAGRRGWLPAGPQSVLARSLGLGAIVFMLWTNGH